MQEDRMLLDKVRAMLSRPDNERINFIIEGFFIEYPYKDKVYRAIFDLLEQPVRPRMDGLLLYSPTNNGKTTLVKRFVTEFDGKVGGKIKYVEVPERVTLKEFYAETLNRLGYPVTASRATGDLRRKILQGFREQRVALVIYDEIQNLLKSKRDNQSDILDGLKSLNNRAEIPIVLVGVETAVEILSKDEQVGERYFPFEIPLWDFDDQFRNLLATFEMNLPLHKPSNLFHNEIAETIYKMSKGKIGRVAKIIRESSKVAIRGKTECITPELIASIVFRWKEDEDQNENKKS